LYTKNTSNRIIVENMIDQEEEQVKDEEHNERLPSILKSNELLEKLFNNGWKFDYSMLLVRPLKLCKLLELFSH